MEPILEAKSLNLWYGQNHALHDVSVAIPERQITAFIGPSGCGKSTFLRTLNRMNDLIPSVKIQGQVDFHGKNIYDAGVDPTLLRKRIGMVFQKANPFPMSIYDNVAYGPRTHGVRSHAKLDDIVERSLRSAAIWDEVKDRLKKSAMGLSGGQQQRLCIARALAVEPEVLLMDEATSALDPISTSRIEDLALELKEHYTVVMVTHNMQQAARISDNTAFFLLGELVEFGKTEQLFSDPTDNLLYEEVFALPERYRIVILLYYYEEYSIQEIADLTGRKISTIQTQLARARKKLKLALTEQGRDFYEQESLSANYESHSNAGTL